MVYGTGWVIFSGESTARFVVMVFALAVTLGLGYLKFVGGRRRARRRQRRERGGRLARRRGR